MSISASLVMKLRERTGAGMMECKKFLQQTDGDIEQAILEMRKAGGDKADKKANRIAAEGVISIEVSDDKTNAAMLEVNSETDFVARDDNFMKFAQISTSHALNLQDESVEKLSESTESDKSIEQLRQELVAKIGENIKIRRIKRIHTQGLVGHYLHGSKIGVLVELKGGNDTLARDIAMHIAASKPIVVSASDVPADAIENEREVFTAQARESGKPQDIIDKMIEGRINKFVNEVSLLGQPFVKDPNKKISQILKEENAEVISFCRFEVGEGIEKKEDDFVSEVMAQVRD